MATPAVRPRRVGCREITETDHAAVADLLAQGFPGRPVAHWLRGFARQSSRQLPGGVPRYGYLLESEGQVVGALLVIYAVRQGADGRDCLRCNLSSWFVDPAFRSYATLLTSIAQKNRDVTFVNLTPARNTWPIIEAQGFRDACKGLFFSCPVLNGGAGTVERIRPSRAAIEGLPDVDAERLRDHAAFGCVSLVCRTPDGAFPFILKPFRIRNGRIPVPAMQLIHARTLDDYLHCAGPLGRHLAPRGWPFVVLGAEGPIAGLRGLFTDRRGRRYVRGPNPPGLCDLTDSEIVLFGV